MSAAHTPGPWLLARNTPTFVFAMNPQGYNRFWADVCGGNTGPLERTTDEELEANARLIAAAPELLEALERLLQSGDVRDAADAGALRNARSAIAKAKGEQQ